MPKQYQLVYILVVLHVVPTCPIPKGDNYNLTNHTRPDYREGHTLTIECNNGYTVDGVRDVVCSNNSLWKPQLPNCVLTGKIYSSTMPA